MTPRGRIPGAAELAFVGMMLSAIVAEALFVLGYGLSPLPFWAGTGAAVFLAGFRSRRCLLGVLAIYCFGLLVSLANACYATSDALCVYFPMQRILAEGWNPIWEMSRERICAYAGTTSVASPFIEHCPQLTALVAAMVDRSFGLFNADPFCGIVMVSALCSLAYRFAMAYWQRRLPGIALAAGVALSTKTTSFLSGHVDYTIYSMMLAALFSLGLWIRLNRGTDLWLFMLAIAGAMASKATGVPFAIACCLVLVAWSWRDGRFWRIFVPGLFVVLLLCLSPYVVSIVRHGTPFPAIDLTSDFTGNADALKMGWPLRCVYAWVSPRAAIAIGKIVYGGSFMPAFDLQVEGYGSAYRFLLLVSVLALALSRRDFVVVFCALLFVTGNLLPTKYIGYNRYCPQMWCLPMVAVLNFLCSCEAKGRVFKRALGIGRNAMALAVLSWACLMAARSVAYFERSVAWHSARVHEIKAMGRISKAWRIESRTCPSKCALMKLCKRHGLDITDDEGAPEASVNVEYAIISASPIDAGRISRFAATFPMVNSPGALFAFGWLEACGNPHL